MQQLLLLSLLICCFISIIFTYPCTTVRCCRRGNIESNCCRRNNDCNPSRCLENCVDCSRRMEKNCNPRCPEEDCSDDDCCPTDPPPNPNHPTTTSSNPTTPPNPNYPTFPPFTFPPWPQSNSSSYSNNTNISRNNNTITIPTNINIQNEIRSETRISIPVSIKVDTVNNINIKQEEFITTNTSNYYNKCENTSTINNNTNNGKNNCTPSTLRPTTTIPAPIYRPIPVPYIITVPRPVPVPQGCCQVVSPCSPYNYGGCQRSSTQCSQDCSESHVYQPADVCGGGCYRRSAAMGGFCGSGGCYRRQVNCGTCNSRFFEDYESFVRCSGCFVPRPWGH